MEERGIMAKAKKSESGHPTREGTVSILRWEGWGVPWSCLSDGHTHGGADPQHTRGQAGLATSIL